MPRLLAPSLLGAALCLSPVARAFAPGGGVHVYLSSKTHSEVTEEALDKVYVRVGLSKVTKSMKAARKQLTDANKEVDNDQKSSAKHFDGENFSGGQTLVNGLLSKAVTQAKAEDYAGARASVGAALHTVQDFYAHSNWVELGNGGPSAELGRPGSIGNTAGPADVTCRKVAASCNVANLTGSLLTSGYYGGEDRSITAGKCRHGGFFDLGLEADGTGKPWSPGPFMADRQALPGISKDSAVCLGDGYKLLDSPHSDFNPGAAAVATQATLQVFEDLRGKLTESQFKALLGVGPSLGFAIDTTGSMGSVIAGVRNAAIGIVDARLGTDREPSKYVLSPFNDPGVGPTTSTSDASRFKLAIGRLFAGGGDDCPELSMAGTYAAVDLSDDGGDVFVFTDASAKDAALFPSVMSLASSKKVKVFFSLFGSCSPYDPAYFQIANASGGQVFVLDRGEAGTVTRLSDILARNDAVDIENRQGNMVAGSMLTIPFLVDSTTTRLNVSYSNIDSTSLALYRPDGTLVYRGAPGVDTIGLSNGIIHSISNPSVGQWRALIVGSGQYSLLVNGESPLSLDDFSFVEQGGRDGHQGYYAIAGLPLVGKPTKAVARLSGAPRSVSFELRDLNGELLLPFRLADADTEANWLAGELTVPGRSFRVFAVGADPGGAAFQRLVATVIVPQSVSVNPPAAVDLGQGQATTYIFEVRNEGAPDTFRFAAKDTQGFVAGGMNPASATLGTGQSVLTKVVLNVGGGVPVGTRDTLTVTATSTTRPDVRNFAVITSTVVAPKLFGDVNRDGRVDCDDLALIRASFGSKTGSRSFNPDVDVDSNGAIDIRDLASVTRLLPAGTVCPR